jgi:hypothetical protein
LPLQGDPRPDSSRERCRQDWSANLGKELSTVHSALDIVSSDAAGDLYQQIDLPSIRSLATREHDISAEDLIAFLPRKEAFINSVIE